VFLVPRTFSQVADPLCTTFGPPLRNTAVMYSCEYGNGPFGSIKGGQFLEWTRCPRLLNKNSRWFPAHYRDGCHRGSWAVEGCPSVIFGLPGRRPGTYFKVNDVRCWLPSPRARVVVSPQLRSNIDWNSLPYVSPVSACVYYIYCLQILYFIIRVVFILQIF
jgi:hypothetical protein